MNWLYAENSEYTLPDHGWKFHVSARPKNFRSLVAVLVPYLLDRGCTFKLARSLRVLGELNDGASPASSVGKAVTIYPDQEDVTGIGADLAVLLRGRSGPRVLSDRRVSPDAPVYYRYGPFRATYRANGIGNLASVMIGPDGEVVDGWATSTYRVPLWVSDPFESVPSRTGGETAPSDRPARLGGHYEPRSGLAESARGAVYTAIDLRTGETVVVKQGRPYVAESLDGHDARTHLRNERFVLTALSDVPGVARFRDHFRHGDDEYLVTSFDGRSSLSDDILRRGRYLVLADRTPDAPVPELASSRTLEALAHRLARTLREIHARGYLVRDLSPKNLVVGDSGEITFVDFGHCHHHDVAIPGGTKGYAPARQVNGEPAESHDDLHALGMTLFAAMIGAEPPVDEGDADASRLMALQVIDRMFGTRPPPVVSAVADLLSGEPETMAVAFAAMADGPILVRPRRGAGRRYEADPARLVDHLLTRLVDRADKTLDEATDPDPGVYSGASGVGLALIPHLDRLDVASTVRRLAEFSALAADRVRLRPGLYLGATGVELFLRQAMVAGVTSAVPLSASRLFGEAEPEPADRDIINGVAGIGLGHALLHELDPRSEHEDMIDRCARWLTEYEGADSGADRVAGRDTTVGVAHGRAGVVEFLRHRYRLAPSGQTRTALDAELAALVDRVERFIVEAAKPTAVPLCTSWCRGLAGMGRSLLAVGRQLHDDALIDLAVACADGCLRWLPQIVTPGQCCGVAGIGELFCDLIPYDDRFRGAAESAVTQLLVLRADSFTGAVTRNRLEPGGMSWAGGMAGVLGFLTRLRDHTTGMVTAPFTPVAEV